MAGSWQRSFDDWLKTATEEELEEAIDQTLHSLLAAQSEEAGHSPENARVGEPPENAAPPLTRWPNVGSGRPWTV